MAVDLASPDPQQGVGAPRGAMAFVERRLGITVSGLSLGVLAVMSWFLALKFGGRAMYLMAYCGAVLLMTAVILARRRRPVEAVRASVPQRARVGQTLTVDLTVTARSRLTTFRLEEQVHPQLGTTMVLPVPLMAAGEELHHQYALSPKLRGVYSIGPLTAEFSDPMGLSKRQQLLAGPTEIIVHPNVEDVLDRPLTRAFEEPPLRPPKSRPWPQGFEFYGMRDYVRGDDMRRVVWRAFARTDRLLVREFEQGISDRISIMLDTDAAWHSPGFPSESFETAVRVAASVGTRHIKDGFTVRLDANYDRLGGFRGPRARLPFLDELARVHLSEQALSDGLGRLARSNRRDAHVVIVTSHLSSAAAGAANLLVAGGASLTVCVVLWAEFDPTTLKRATEIGAQVVQVKPGAGSFRGVFRASLQTKAGGSHR